MILGVGWEGWEVEIPKRGSAAHGAFDKKCHFACGFVAFAAAAEGHGRKLLC
jgi:hypothetical protein